MSLRRTVFSRIIGGRIIMEPYKLKSNQISIRLIRWHSAQVDVKALGVYKVGLPDLELSYPIRLCMYYCVAYYVRLG